MTKKCQIFLCFWSWWEKIVAKGRSHPSVPAMEIIVKPIDIEV